MDFEVMGIRPRHHMPVDEPTPKRRVGRPKVVRVLESESAFADRYDPSSFSGVAPWAPPAPVPGAWVDRDATVATPLMARPPPSSSSMGQPIGSVTEIYRVPDSSSGTMASQPQWYAPPPLTGSAATGRHWPGPIPSPATGPTRGSPPLQPGMQQVAPSTMAAIPSVLTPSDSVQRPPFGSLPNSGRSSHSVANRVNGDIVGFPPAPPPPPPPNYTSQSQQQQYVAQPLSSSNKRSVPDARVGKLPPPAFFPYVDNSTSFGQSPTLRPAERVYDELVNGTRNAQRSYETSQRRDGARTNYPPNPPTVPPNYPASFQPSPSSPPILSHHPRSGNSRVDHHHHHHHHHVTGQTFPSATSPRQQQQQQRHTPLMSPHSNSLHLPQRPSPPPPPPQTLPQTMLATSS
jgi:hypothetical protein